MSGKPETFLPVGSEDDDSKCNATSKKRTSKKRNLEDQAPESITSEMDEIALVDKFILQHRVGDEGFRQTALRLLDGKGALVFPTQDKGKIFALRDATKTDASRSVLNMLQSDSLVSLFVVDVNAIETQSFKSSSSAHLRIACTCLIIDNYHITRDIELLIHPSAPAGTLVIVNSRVPPRRMMRARCRETLVEKPLTVILDDSILL
jgi:hypothetical protein